MRANDAMQGAIRRDTAPGEGDDVRAGLELRVAPVRLALLPTSMPTNPYPELLARAVSSAGADLVPMIWPGWRWLFTEARRVDVLHLHWIHIFYRREDRPWLDVPLALAFVVWLLCFRLSGKRLVWTMHNAQPHESPSPLADGIAQIAMANLATVIVHCDAARELLRRRKRFGSTVMIPHGSYAGVYPATISRAEARRRLDIESDRVVFVAFGLVREYKGLDALVSAFEEMVQADDRADRATLIIAGKPRTDADRAYADRLRRLVDRGDVRFRFEFVPDDEVQTYMRAADYAVAAFERILVSGSAILALSFGTPVIAPEMGCLPELLAGGAGITYSSQAGVGAALRRAMSSDRAAHARAAEERARELDWDRIGRRHVDVYRGAA